MISVIALLIAFCSCRNHHGQIPVPIEDTACNRNTVFCTNFEEADWRSVWDDYDGNPDHTNKLIENPGPFNIKGNHVINLRVPDGESAADMVKVLPQQYEKLFVRWYQYWTPGYNFTQGSHGSGLYAGERWNLGKSGYKPNGEDFVYTLFEPSSANNDLARPYLYTYYKGMYQDCADPNGSCWGDHFPCFIGPTYCTNAAHTVKGSKLPPPVVAGKWYKIEIMLDMGNAVTDENKANGILNFWINDVEYGPWNKLWFRNSNDLKISILWMNLWHPGGSTKGVYIDNIAVSTQPFH